MTYTSFVDSLRNLVVAGVKKVYDSSPSQLSSAMLPVMYPRLPEGSIDIVTLTSGGGLLSCACELVIVISAVGQNNSAPNMDLALTVMDSLHAELTENAQANGYDRWAMRIEIDSYGDATAYWQVVTRVEASG